MFAQDTAANIQATLGDNLLRSPSAFYMAAMNTNISDVSFFMPKNAAMRELYLLPIRQHEWILPGFALYTVSIGVLHGMQLGDPERGQYPLQVDLFDAQEHEFKLLIRLRRDAKKKITQPEINAIMQSIRPVPEDAGNVGR
jgi:hypothetical protein